MKKSAWDRILYAILASTLVFMTGCSDPKNYDVKKLTEEQRKELGKKLTADEGQRLTAWMLRNAIGGKDVPDGTTIAQAIKEQDAWNVKVKDDEAKAEELKKRVESERKAKQYEFAKLLSVAVTAKRNSTGEYDQRLVLLDVAFENKGTKDIAGVKSLLRITDMFGDKVIDLKWSFDDGVDAGKTFVEKGSGLKINKFMDDHMKLWNSDLEKLKFSFEVQKIIFKDGTFVETP